MRTTPLLALLAGAALIAAWRLAGSGVDDSTDRPALTGPAEAAGEDPARFDEVATATGDTFDVGGAAIPLVTSTQEDVQAVFQACRAATAEDVASLRSAANRSPDPLVVSNAVQALGRLGELRAGDPLTALLSDPRERVRHETVRALGATADPDAVALLVPLLESQDGTLRHLTIQALGFIGTEEARAALEAFAPGDDVERAFVRSALAR